MPGCPSAVRSYSNRTAIRSIAATRVCDFCVAVTATFRVLYVFVVMEVGARRLVHSNVTPHPTAVWTVQQFREVLAEAHPYLRVHPP